jgi:hypothetical protein
LQSIEEHFFEVVLFGEYPILSVLAIYLNPMLIPFGALFLKRVQRALKFLLCGDLIDVTNALDILFSKQK